MYSAQIFPPRRLRILHVSPTLTVGGAEQIACHMMVGLAKSHEVAAAGLFARSNSPIENRLANAGVKMWHLNKRDGFDPRMFGALDTVLREFRPDIVHTQMSVLRYLYPVLLRRPIPAVHTLQNVAEHETDAFGRMVHWLAFRSGIRPVAVSHEVAASVERVYRLKCPVVANCVPVADYRRNPGAGEIWRAKEGFAPEDILFICVGRLEPQKNTRLLIDAFADLKNPRAHLLLLGEGSLKKNLTSYVHDQRLEKVHLLGKRENVAEILAACDVFVLGSDWEGNPLAVMEAMAAGLPVISTSVGGVPELVDSGTHGLLVDAGDRKGFTEAMRVLINDPALRDRMAAAAETRAFAEFDAERMVREYSRMFQSIVYESSPTARNSTATAA